jgi:hypothetical protein
VVSREQVHAGRAWIQTGQLSLRRDVVTETCTIEVAVRREILVVAGTAMVIADADADGVGVPRRQGRCAGRPMWWWGRGCGPPLDAWAAAVSGPLTIVLGEQVPAGGFARGGL